MKKMNRRLTAAVTMVLGASCATNAFNRLDTAMPKLLAGANVPGAAIANRLQDARVDDRIPTERLSDQRDACRGRLRFTNARREDAEVALRRRGVGEF